MKSLDLTEDKSTLAQVMSFKFIYVTKHLSKQGKMMYEQCGTLKNGQTWMVKLYMND